MSLHQKCSWLATRYIVNCSTDSTLYLVIVQFSKASWRITSFGTQDNLLQKDNFSPLYFTFSTFGLVAHRQIHFRLSYLIYIYIYIWMFSIIFVVYAHRKSIRDWIFHTVLVYIENSEEAEERYEIQETYRKLSLGVTSYMIYIIKACFTNTYDHY